MTNRELAIDFSNGCFSNIFDRLAEGIVWNIYGEKKIEGRAAVIKHCNEVAGYFASVQTDFKTYRVIENAGAISINGRAVFTKEGETVAVVNACDVYEFDEDGCVYHIMSYCITEK